MKDHRNVFPHTPGGSESEIKVWAEPCSLSEDARECLGVKNNPWDPWLVATSLQPLLTQPMEAMEASPSFQAWAVLPAWSWDPALRGSWHQSRVCRYLVSLPETWDLFFWLKKIKSAVQLFKKTKTLGWIYTSLGIPSNGPKTTDSLRLLLPNFPSLSLKLKAYWFLERYNLLLFLKQQLGQCLYRRSEEQMLSVHSGSFQP